MCLIGHVLIQKNECKPTMLKLKILEIGEINPLKNKAIKEIRRKNSDTQADRKTGI